MKKLLECIATVVLILLMCISVTACSDNGPDGKYVVESVQITGKTYNIGETIPHSVCELLNEDVVVSEDIASVVIYENGLITAYSKIDKYFGFRGSWKKKEEQSVFDFEIDHFQLEFTEDGKLLLNDPRETGTETHSITYTVTYVLHKQ